MDANRREEPRKETCMIAKGSHRRQETRLKNSELMKERRGRIMLGECDKRIAK